MVCWRDGEEIKDIILLSELEQIWVSMTCIGKFYSYLYPKFELGPFKGELRMATDILP